MMGGMEREERARTDLQAKDGTTCSRGRSCGRAAEELRKKETWSEEQPGSRHQWQRLG